MATLTICPNCRYPYDDKDVVVVGVRPVHCALCGWDGSSEDLILVPFGDRVLDMRGFRALLLHLAQDVSPQVGSALVRFGLVPKSTDPKNLEYLTALLALSTRNLFETVVRAVADPDATVLEARRALRVQGNGGVN